MYMKNYRESVEADLMYYTIKPGDNIYKIADEYNIAVNDLIRLNGITNPDLIYINQIILVPKKNVKIVITNPGETLSLLLKRENLTLTDILNYKENIYLLPDQLLIFKNNN